MKIIVAVCTYKRHTSLERCVVSMKKMTIPTGCEVEFLIVDNQPHKIIQEIADKYHITYRAEISRGLVFARNHVLDYARQQMDVDYLGIVDDDEELSVSWICEMLDGFQKTNADALAGVIDIVSDNPNTPPYLIKAYQFSKVTDYKTVKTLPMGNVMLGRNILESKICFDIAYNFTGGEDINFFSKATQAGFKLVKSPKASVKEYLMPEKASLLSYFKRQLRVSELHYRQKYPETTLPYFTECGLSFIEIGIAILIMPLALIHDKSKIVAAKYFAKGLGRFFSRRSISRAVYGQ